MGAEGQEASLYHHQPVQHSSRVEPVTQVPECPARHSGVTRAGGVWDLASHTAGVPSGEGLPHERSGGESESRLTAPWKLGAHNVVFQDASVPGQVISQEATVLQNTSLQTTRSSLQTKMNKLQKQHTKVSSLRQNVYFQRQELQEEYQDLNSRMNDVVLSQEDLMNAWRDEFSARSPRGVPAYLEKIWGQVRRDAATYTARLARIGQLENLLLGPEAQLLVAENSFVKTVDRASTSARSAETKRSRARSRPGEDAQIPTNVEIDQPQPTFTEELQSLRADLAMQTDRLFELECDQADDLAARELITERGDESEISEAEFMHSYWSTRVQIERDIKRAQSRLYELDPQALPERRPTVSKSGSCEFMEDDLDLNEMGSAPENEHPNWKTLEHLSGLDRTQRQQRRTEGSNLESTSPEAQAQFHWIDSWREFTSSSELLPALLPERRHTCSGEVGLPQTVLQDSKPGIDRQRSYRSHG